MSGQKRIREDSQPTAPTHNLSHTLNVQGCAAVVLDDISDNVEFIARLDAGSSLWFRYWISQALRDATLPTFSKKGESDTEKNASYLKGRAAFREMHPNGPNANDYSTYNAFLELFDPGTDDGRKNFFCPRLRKTAVDGFVSSKGLQSDIAAGLAIYLHDRLTYVKQGNSRMALASMHRSWSNTGFGMWAHINPAIGFHAAIALRAALAECGLNTRLSGLPHLIYKPPEIGTELKSHTDGPRPKAMLASLDAFHSTHGRFPTTIEWMRIAGVQSLVHHQGGFDDGYTFAIGPMTPTKLHACLRAIETNEIERTDTQLFKNANAKPKPGEAAVTERRRAFLTGGDGPSFILWKENLGAFNKILEKKGLEPIGVVPIRPASNDGSSFAAIWPVGFPHGSEANKKRRITTTAPLDMGTGQRDGRVTTRVRAYAVLSDPDEAFADALEVSEMNDFKFGYWMLRGMAEPFAGGLTHRHPDLCGLYVDARPSHDLGWFRALAPTCDDAEDFVGVWEEDA